MKIEVFVDDETEPRASFDAPGTFDLDTTDLPDGPHTLRVLAHEAPGAPGIEQIPFIVRNGPGIAIFGIREREAVRGRLPILVNAYASRPGDEFEPVRAETPAPIPTWAWVLALIVVAWGLYYLAAEYRQHAAVLAAAAPGSEPSSAPPDTAAPRDGGDESALGEQIFGNYCAACHQLSGDGVPGVFPPLRGDPVVLAEDPTEHILVILSGLAGKTIDGVAYVAAMPPFGAQLTDEQIAAVINHERTAWGNAAALVTPLDVGAARSSAPVP